MIMITIFLIIINSFMTLAEITYPYDSNQYGNANFMYGSTGSYSLSSPPTFYNRTICQPFISAESGYLSSIFFDGSNSSNMDIKTAVSNKLCEPFKRDCGPYSVYKNYSNSWIDKPINITEIRDDFYISSGNTYYFCISGDSNSGTGTGISASVFTSVINTGYENVTSGYSYNSRDFSTDKNFLWSKYYTFSGGTYSSLGFIEKEATTLSFQYCLDNSKCFSVNPAGTYSSYASDNIRDSNLGGQVFKFSQSENNLNGVSFYMAKGTATAGNEKYRIELHNYDTTTNTTNGLIYSSDEYTITDLNSYPTYSKKTFSIDETELIPNNDYLIAVNCSSGCSGSAVDGLYIMHNPYDENLKHGFQNDYSFYSLESSSDAFFILNFTSPVFYDDDISIDLENLIFCPADHCLFYDDYSDYSDNADLSNYGYSLNTETAIIKDNLLYLNSSSDIYPRIYHNFTGEDNYNKIENIIVFSINGTEPTPDNLENQPISYFLATICDNGNDAHIIHFAFSKDTEKCSENETRLGMYSYSSESAKPKTFGYYCYPNNEDIVIKNTFNDDNQNIEILAYYESFFSENFNPESLFSIDYRTTCNSFKGFEIGRRDFSNPVNIDFLGIKKLTYYGIVTQETGDEFIYTNETTINDSIVKTDVGEELHNVAFTLGFKKDSTKLLFWLLFSIFIMMGFVSGISEYVESKVALSMISLIAGFLLFVTGFYLGFIGLSVFVFGILVIVIILIALIIRFVEGN